jgi:hypothetical protein
VQNSSSKLNDDGDGDLRGSSKMSSSGGSWHQNNLTAGAQKAGLSSSYQSSSSSLSNSNDLNDNSDANKANYSAMTKKRKAMHQANSSSSNRNSADENVNK